MQDVVRLISKYYQASTQEQDDVEIVVNDFISILNTFYAWHGTLDFIVDVFKKRCEELHKEFYAKFTNPHIYLEERHVDNLLYLDQALLSLFPYYLQVPKISNYVPLTREDLIISPTVNNAVLTVARLLNSHQSKLASKETIDIMKYVRARELHLKHFIDFLYEAAKSNQALATVLKKNLKNLAYEQVILSNEEVRSMGQYMLHIFDRFCERPDKLHLSSREQLTMGVSGDSLRFIKTAKVGANINQMLNVQCIINSPRWKQMFTSLVTESAQHDPRQRSSFHISEAVIFLNRAINKFQNNNLLYLLEKIVQNLMLVLENLEHNSNLDEHIAVIHDYMKKLTSYCKLDEFGDIKSLLIKASKSLNQAVNQAADSPVTRFIHELSDVSMKYDLQLAISRNVPITKQQIIAFIIALIQISLKACDDLHVTALNIVLPTLSGKYQLDQHKLCANIIMSEQIILGALDWVLPNSVDKLKINPTATHRPLLSV
jgi:hypothetical protein